MDEYIKKNVLYKIIAQLEELARNRYLDTPSLYYSLYNDPPTAEVYSMPLIAALPIADVAPVRHGRWENGNPICPVCGGDKFKDLDADIWSDWKPAFCPNCGAKMDLE